MNTPNEISIGDISNYYGGLSVKTDGGKHYWSIDDYNGNEWKEIPENLYRVLVQYEKARQEAEE